MIKLRPSRLLVVWWAALHAVPALAVLLASPSWPLSAAVLLAVLLHYSRGPRPAATLLLLGPGRRLALPLEGKFDLIPDRASSVSRHWAELIFRPSTARLLLFRDQFTESDWRRLTIALRERQ